MTTAEQPRVRRAVITLELEDGTLLTVTGNEPDAAGIRTMYNERPWYDPVNYGPLPIEPPPDMIANPFRVPIQFTVTLGFRHGREDGFLSVERSAGSDVSSAQLLAGLEQSPHDGMSAAEAEHHLREFRPPAGLPPGLRRPG